MNPQQDIITTLRAQLSEARKTANELTDEKVRLERELTTRVRLDDPVVKGLVEALEGYTSWTDSASVDFIAAEKALSAYNARLKEVGCE